MIASIVKNVNGLNITITRHRVTEYMKKLDPVAYKRLILALNIHGFKWLDGKRYHMQVEIQRKEGIEIYQTKYTIIQQL